MKKFMLYAANFAASASVFLAGMFVAIIMECGLGIEPIMGIVICAIARVLAFVLHKIAMETEEDYVGKN